mgnify:CR=1 FL=1
MNKQVRVNIRTAVNAAKIRTEKRNGREVMVIPSATLPDGVVMNQIRYPAAAIAASYRSLERSLAPLGHPKANDGGFLSAKDPEAINAYHIGAFNENVRQENGRVLMDKVIDLSLANATEGGRRVLEAIKKGEPIHTSTGLIASLKPLENDSEAQFEVEDMIFDHDAILLDEPGAATPDQGVGMLVNGQKIEVINSDYVDQVDRRFDYAIEEVARALEAKAKQPMMQRIKDTLLSLLGTGEGSNATEDEKEAKMAFTPEEAEELKNSVSAMQAKLDKLTGEGTEKQIEAMNAALAQINARFEAEDQAKLAAAEAEKAELEETVVNHGLLDKEAAKEASIETLRALANVAVTAAPIVGHYVNQQKGTIDLAAQFPKE